MSPLEQLDAAEQAAIDTDRGHLAGRIDGDRILHLHSTPTDGAELFVVRGGRLHRIPMDPRFAPKPIYRLWRATRFGGEP